MEVHPTGIGSPPFSSFGSWLRPLPVGSSTSVSLHVPRSDLRDLAVSCQNSFYFLNIGELWDLFPLTFLVSALNFFILFRPAGDGSFDVVSLPLVLFFFNSPTPKRGSRPWLMISFCLLAPTVRGSSRAIGLHSPGH